MTHYIKDAAQDLLDTLSKKNSDYAPTTEFSNFECASKFAGVMTVTAIDVQIAIKWTRLESLKMQGGRAYYESIEDTVKDLAGYLLIRNAYFAMLRENGITEDINGTA